MKIKILSVFAVILFLLTTIPIEATPSIDKQLEEIVPNDDPIIIRQRKIGRVGIFIINIDREYKDEDIEINVTLKRGFLTPKTIKEFSMDALPSVRFDFFFPALKVSIDVDLLVNNTIVGSDSASFTKILTKKHMICAMFVFKYKLI